MAQNEKELKGGDDKNVNMEGAVLWKVIFCSFIEQPSFGTR